MTNQKTPKDISLAGVSGIGECTLVRFPSKLMIPAISSGRVIGAPAQNVTRAAANHAFTAA